MPKFEDIQHSVLIVSASRQFLEIAGRSLDPVHLVETKKSAATARRCILERYYDLIIINAPLPDETGEELAVDITEQCRAAILLVVPQDIYEDVAQAVTDYGILVLARPFPRGRMDKMIRFLLADQNKVRQIENQMLALEEKLEDLRIINKAKFFLVEQKGMTEDEAHRAIGRQAMNEGVSRRRIAERIMDEE